MTTLTLPVAALMPDIQYKEVAIPRRMCLYQPIGSIGRSRRKDFTP